MENIPKLCLNMIVKNESKIITRLFDSVSSIIDYYCICDTGSTDNTISVITDYFREKNIPGIICEEPFKDFGYNRTYSLKQCSELEVDYILLLDADMVLDIRDNDVDAFKKSLNADAYFIFQGSDDFFYKNMRIIKNDPGFRYWGVTHEYLIVPDAMTSQTIDKTMLFIKDIGDGGAKTDKFERDIRLLKDGLKESPNNERYTFYLANSYSDSGQLENAIETYKKRIELGGWEEEIWYSCYSIGNCYQKLNNSHGALFYWMKGVDILPSRIENLYEIVKYYREVGNNRICNLFYDIADQIRKKKTTYDHLFLRQDVYDYKLDYEFSINGYYVNPNKIDVGSVCMKLLNHTGPPPYIKNNILQNYKSYVTKLSDIGIESSNFNILENIGSTLTIDKNVFVSSTPTMCYDPTSKRLIVNVRFVDYKIGANGEYITKSNIITKNVVAIVNIHDNPWKIQKEFELKYDKEYDNVYIGIEDIRLFSYDNKIYFSGNRGLQLNTIFVEYGIINLKTERTISNLITCNVQQPVEKNWVLFSNNKEVYIIYGWSPLQIGLPIDDLERKIDNNKKIRKHLDITNTIPTPPIFSYIRGSTNGLTIGNEIWFICHAVSYESRRHYYHLFVVLDSTTFKMNRFSKLFTFEKQPVEYTLGFIYLEEKNQFMIGYSTMDSTTKYILLDEKHVDALFL